MTPQLYIQSLLESLKELVTPEHIPPTTQAMEDAVLAKVLSKKFRKVKADEKTVATAQRAVHYAIANNQPVTVSFLFGGNKLWRFAEAPEPDWAELFAVLYFLRWMKSIAAVYPPGAKLDFYSEDVAVETLNNVPRSETQHYSQIFRAMLEWLSPYLPDRVTTSYRRYAEEYDRYDDYLRELETAKKEVLAANNGNLPTLTDRQKTATELNVRLLPGQADDPLWREKVELTHRALEETPTLRKYFNDPSLVMACPTSYSGWIAVGSTKRSYAKFWAGVGALQKAGETYHELVLTPKQLETAAFAWQDVHLEGLQGKNFSRVRVLEEN